MTRPEPEEPASSEESNEDKRVPAFNGRQPGGEYFVRKIDLDLVVPWRGR